MKTNELKCCNCPDKYIYNGEWRCALNKTAYNLIIVSENNDAPDWCYRKVEPDKPHWHGKKIIYGPHGQKHYVYLNEKDFKNDMRVLNDYADAWWDVGIWGIDYYGRNNEYLGFEESNNFKGEYLLSCEAVKYYLEGR